MPPENTADKPAQSSIPEIRVPGLLTLAGLILGLALGLALSGTSLEARATAIATPIGELWLKALKMTILPLVAGLLFTGIVETVGAARSGLMARRTLGFIIGLLATSAILGAVLMPLLLGVFPAPHMSLGATPALGGGPQPSAELPGIADFFDSLLASNILAAASEDAMLPVVIFIALFALGSTRLSEAPRRQLALLFEGLAGAMIVVIGWVLALAPLGVLGLGFTLGAGQGVSAIGTLAHYIALVSCLGGVFLLGAYPLAVIVGKKRLVDFFRAMLPVQVVAISTQSSLASLPSMLAACRKLEVAPATSEFVLPLAVTLFRATGPTMNMGVAIYAASLAGHELTAPALAAGALVAFLTTFGAVSLPGTISFIASIGPIAVAMGVPLWPLGLLVAVEMLPDIMRTVGNVTMNVAVTSAVDGDRELHVEPETATIH